MPVYNFNSDPDYLGKKARVRKILEEVSVAQLKNIQKELNRLWVESRTETWPYDYRVTPEYDKEVEGKINLLLQVEGHPYALSNIINAVPHQKVAS